MCDLDEEWLSFQSSTINEIQNNKTSEKVNISPKIEMPKCSEIYISTKTRTCELNSTIDFKFGEPACTVVVNISSTRQF